MFTCRAMKSPWSQKRGAILADHDQHPQLSARKLGKRHSCHHSTVSKYISEERRGVVGRPGGRPTALSSLQVKGVVKKAVAQRSASSVRLASNLRAQGIAVSSKTVNRNLRENGIACGYPKRVPPLKAVHKTKRMKWASRFLNSRRSFTGWMFTDSKYFLLKSLSSKRGSKVYYQKGNRPSVAGVSHSRGVHFYLGVTNYGATEPVLATGGGVKKPSYPRENGKGMYSGVCGLEYRSEILPKLIAGGNKLFSSQSKWVDRWVFQQDNASIHKSQESLEKVVELMGGNDMRVELEWPALSPDLSWIENVWGWAENELEKRRGEIETLPELEKEVRSILGRIPLAFMQKLVAGMKGRLVEVGERDGKHVGK
jgi:hypothetical protein